MIVNKDLEVPACPYRAANNNDKNKDDNNNDNDNKKKKIKY